MAYGWQIFDANGALVADNSVIMSRRLGTYLMPLTRGAWRITVPVSLNGGTPFAHCVAVRPVVPPNSVWRPVVPDINFGNGIMTVSYTQWHFAFPYDDVGISSIYLGSMRIHYGVYNQ